MIRKNVMDRRNSAVNAANTAATNTARRRSFKAATFGLPDNVKYGSTPEKSRQKTKREADQKRARRATKRWNPRAAARSF